MSKGLGFGPISMYLIDIKKGSEDIVLVKDRQRGQMVGDFAERLVLSSLVGKSNNVCV